MCVFMVLNQRTKPPSRRNEFFFTKKQCMIICVYLSYLQWAECDTKSNSNWSKTGLNSGYYFLPVYPE